MSRMVYLIASHPDMTRWTACRISACPVRGRVRYLGGEAGRGSRRSGWPAGTSTRTIRVPSGSVIHISVRPRARFPDDGDSGCGQPGVLGADVPDLDTDHHRPPAGPSACPETLRDPCPRKKTISHSPCLPGVQAAPPFPATSPSGPPRTSPRATPGRRPQRLIRPEAAPSTCVSPAAGPGSSQQLTETGCPDLTSGASQASAGRGGKADDDRGPRHDRKDPIPSFPARLPHLNRLMPRPRRRDA
jgi:hypothetical protein